MSEPRNHHYIPQFWLKRFSHDGNSKLVWSYDWAEDTVKERSIKIIMSEYDLYTQQTSGGNDVSLETGEMGRVDSSGSALFRRLDQGERSAVLRDELADFFSVMALRHPATVSRFPEVAAGFLCDLQSILADATTPADLDKYLASIGASPSGITSAEFATIRSATSADLDLFFTSHFDKQLASGGNEEIPYADAIKDRSGRDILRDRILKMEWTLASTPEPTVLIGDIGILLERGNSDQGWKIAIGPQQILSIAKTEQPVPAKIGGGTLKSWEVDRVNVETAARSKRLLAGRSKATLEKASAHVKGGEY